MPDHVTCTCCGELIAPTEPEGEYACACEWDGCDDECPVVGHLYRAEDIARRIVHEATVALAKRGDHYALNDLRCTHPWVAESIVSMREFRIRTFYGFRVSQPTRLCDVTEA